MAMTLIMLHLQGGGGGSDFDNVTSRRGGGGSDFNNVTSPWGWGWQ